MTWSIIAREEKSGRVGIIVASRFFAVGSRVPSIRTGVGAVATQALVNQGFGPKALDLMAAGLAAPDALREILASDDGRDSRQIHLMDSSGRFAVHTGAACIDWCGSYTGADFSIAGNMLAGRDVIEATAEACSALNHLPIAPRLIAAMQAGEAAGGDKRGKQSAGLLVHDAEAFPIYDIRADDHFDPLGELQRLHGVALERFVHFRRGMPNRQNPAGTPDRAELEALIAHSVAEGFE